MTHSIQKAVVLGAGTMGARIAAHFANAGLPCILLDIVPPDVKPDAPPADRNKIVRAGLEAAKTALREAGRRMAAGRTGNGPPMSTEPQGKRLLDAARQRLGVKVLLHPAPQLGALIPQPLDHQFERSIAGRLGDAQMKLAVRLLANDEIIDVGGHARDCLPERIQVFTGVVIGVAVVIGISSVVNGLNSNVTGAIQPAAIARGLA